MLNTTTFRMLLRISSVLKLATCCLVITLVWLGWRWTYIRSAGKRSRITFADFPEALEAASSPDRAVVLAQMDSGYVELAYNFFSTAVQLQGVANCLFVSLDDLGCDLLSSAFPEDAVYCYAYTEHPNSTEAAIFGSPSLVDKLLLKKVYLTDALRLGYTVLQTDIDIVFLQNPLTDLHETCDSTNCDLAIQWDIKRKKYNSGFVYVRPTASSLLLSDLLLSYDNREMGGDQQQLNVAINDLRRRQQNVTLRVTPLSYTRYPVGKQFFPNNKCPKSLGHKSRGVIIVHNNYLKEKDNKIFRFKECLLWRYDGRDGYYSSSTRNYLTYQNTREGGGGAEYQGLLNAFAVGKLLNRTVILPSSFHRADGMKCNLLVRVYGSNVLFMKRFTAVTAADYRESSFLDKPLVPDTVLTSQSPVYLITTPEEQTPHLPGISELVLPDPTRGPTADDIRRWFGDLPFRVLRFHSMYGNYSNLEYESILGTAFVKLMDEF